MRLAAAEATVAIAAVVLVDELVPPAAATTEVLVTVVARQIPGLVGLQPPAQHPDMPPRLTLAEAIVADQVQYTEGDLQPRAALLEETGGNA